MVNVQQKFFDVIPYPNLSPLLNFNDPFRGLGWNGHENLVTLMCTGRKMKTPHSPSNMTNQMDNIFTKAWEPLCQKHPLTWLCHSEGKDPVTWKGPWKFLEISQWHSSTTLDPFKLHIYIPTPHNYMKKADVLQNSIKIYNLHIVASIYIYLSILELSSSVYIKYTSPTRLLSLTAQGALFQGEKW